MNEIYRIQKISINEFKGNCSIGGDADGTLMSQDYYQAIEKNFKKETIPGL